MIIDDKSIKGLIHHKKKLKDLVLFHQLLEREYL